MLWYAALFILYIFSPPSNVCCCVCVIVIYGVILLVWCTNSGACPPPPCSNSSTAHTLAVVFCVSVQCLVFDGFFVIHCLNSVSLTYKIFKITIPAMEKKIKIFDIESPSIPFSLCTWHRIIQRRDNRMNSALFTTCVMESLNVSLSIGSSRAARPSCIHNNMSSDLSQSSDASDS
jgi:hypothetical protein